MRLVLILVSGAALAWASAAAAETLVKPDQSGAVFVCKQTGDNGNTGAEGQPLKNLDKALKQGHRRRHDPGVRRDLQRHLRHRLLRERQGGQALRRLLGGLRGSRSSGPPDAHPAGQQERRQVAQAAVDVFRRRSTAWSSTASSSTWGSATRYHATDGKPPGVETGMLLLPPAKASGDAATVTEPCLSIPSAAKEGEHRDPQQRVRQLRQLRHPGRPARRHLPDQQQRLRGQPHGRGRGLRHLPRARAWAPRPSSPLSAAHVEFDHNTVLFTWSRLKDFLDMGYGFRIMTKLTYDLHDNVFGANVDGRHRPQPLQPQRGQDRPQRLLRQQERRPRVQSRAATPS